MCHLKVTGFTRAALILGLSFLFACDFGSDDITSSGSDVRPHTGSDGEGLEWDTSDLADTPGAEEVNQDDPSVTDTPVDHAVNDESSVIPGPDLLQDRNLETGPLPDAESEEIWTPVDMGSGDGTWSPVDTGSPAEDVSITPVTDVTPVPVGSCYKDEGCSPFQFCDFSENDCGIWGGYGRCTDRPGMCIAGGPGACGCGGVVRTNDCEVQSMGEDVLKYGGCIFSGSRYLCGDRDCDPVTQYCAISLNDVVGPAEPEYYANCIDLPAACMIVVDPTATADCSCLESTLSDFETCSDATGFIMVYYPGG